MVQTFYYMTHITGAVLATVVFVCKSFRKDELKSAITCYAIMAVSLMAAFIVSALLFSYIYKSTAQPLGYAFFAPEYFLTMLVFSLFTMMFFALAGVPFVNKGAFAYSLVIFSLISRAGCFIAGCCEGENGFPIVPLEIIFAATMLTFFTVKKRTGKDLSIYIAAYSIFRFITAFFRADTGEVVFFGLDVRQYVALIAVFAIAVSVVVKTKNAIVLKSLSGGGCYEKKLA